MGLFSVREHVPGPRFQPAQLAFRALRDARVVAALLLGALGVLVLLAASLRVS